MRMKAVLMPTLVVCLGLMLCSGCGGGPRKSEKTPESGYSQKTRDEFMLNCIRGFEASDKEEAFKGKASMICGCMMDKIERSVTPEAFDAYDQAVRAEQEPDPKTVASFTDATSQCVQEHLDEFKP